MVERLSVERSQDFLVKMPKVFRDEIGQIHIFGSVPDLLDGVEFRRVRRKPFDVKPIPVFFLENPDRFPVGVISVEHQDEFASDMCVEGLKELNDRIGSDVSALDPEKETQAVPGRGDFDAGYCGKPAVVIPGILDRSLSSRCPGPSPRGLEHEARFINENDASTASSSLFLYAPSAPSSSVRSPLSPFPGRAALVSDNSSPTSEGYTIRNLRETLPRSGALSSAPREDRSIAPLYNPQHQGLSKVSSSTPLSAWPKASVFVPDAAWPSIPPSRSFLSPPSSVARSRARPQPDEPPPKGTSLPTRASQQADGELPILSDSLLVSYGKYRQNISILFNNIGLNRSLKSGKSRYLRREEAQYSIL